MRRLLAASVLPVALLVPGPADARVPDDFRVRPTAAAPTATATATASTATAPTSTSLPLAGVRIALDPGHQLGNQNFPEQISRLVPAGGFRKPCNTTGTATDGGYPEATFVFGVARDVAARLRALGAEVRMTRTANRQDLWGPCVDARGRFGENAGADLTVSLHADGARPGLRGFHVIAPTARAPWTTDIAAASWQLARALRAGLDARGVRRSTYVGEGTALVRRGDLGTLNLSDVPIAMLELGNMRNLADARLMRSTAGRATYAIGVVRGIRRYLHR